MYPYFYSFLAVISSFYAAHAQSVPYNFSSKQSPWQALENAGELSHEWAPWQADSAFVVPIGFNFKFCMTGFDTVIVREGATVYFGKKSSSGNLVFEGFSKAITDLFWITPGASESLSAISYILSGPPGSRILKIQWKNAGFQTGSPDDFINFQIWLYEGSNILEVHFGPQHITSSSVYEGADCTGPMIGLRNEPDQEYVYLFGPATIPVLGYPPFGFKGLENTPAPDMVYCFSPNPDFSGVQEAPTVQVQHWPMEHKIVLANAIDVEQMILSDLTGKVLQIHQIHPAAQVLHLYYQQQLPGMYLLHVRMKDGMGITQKILITN